ncbi:O-methyltransferase [Modestobacter italicus]|uniref:O-methyltransferase n=1 Tax=Modestobacter italicus (strain DSM 44449 / CECT 9708 / BC 501) TaxID=2732864 RepID=UPI001C96471F|nr:class I SAM-dependent methyltransferase [Modestobacter italicus]
MTEDFDAVVRALHEEGVRADAVQTDRSRRRRNLDPDEAALLGLVCEAMGARRVLEVGTSNGFSTLWLARAVHDRGGTVLSVDVDAVGQRAAAANLARVGLHEDVELRCADGGQVLRELPDRSQDVVFLDADRSHYLDWWPHPVRVLRPGGLLAIDNVLSHPDQVAELRGLIDADPRLRATVSTAGKGLLLAVTRA